MKASPIVSKIQHADVDVEGGEINIVPRCLPNGSDKALMQVLQNVGKTRSPQRKFHPVDAQIAAA